MLQSPHLCIGDCNPARPFGIGPLTDPHFTAFPGRTLVTTSYVLALPPGAQGPCANTNQEERTSCPSVWPGGERTPRAIHCVPGTGNACSPSGSLPVSARAREAGGGVVKESGRHWIAVPGPPSQSGKLGCPWLTAAVAVLVCESQQPTLPSWDFRAVECLEGRLCGSSEKGCVCAVTPQFLEPCREH